MPTSKRLNRRQFMHWLGLTTAAAVVGSCQGQVNAPAPAATTPTPTLTTTRAPAAPTPTSRAQAAATLPPATPTSPAPTPTQSPTVTRQPPTRTATQTATPLPRTQVAIGQVRTYAAPGLRQQIQTMLEGLGGVSALVKPGARVGLKVNLTGGTWWDAAGKPLATETYATHPAVMGALVELLKDAGASQVYIMEGAADETAWAKWGYADMAKPLGATIVNLCQPAPYAGFATVPVGPRAIVYHTFSLNGLLQEMDLFVSVAKMKCHSVAGVTLALKNLIGLTPIDAYKRKPADTNRSAFHGYYDYDTRLPRVIMDLNLARPIDLAVIDGVITCEAGAGPWDKTLAQARPGLLVAGRDPVATDTVAAALMGFDPQAAARTLPFIRTDNYLALAEALELGSNHLNEIPVVGGTVETLRFPFKPTG